MATLFGKLHKNVLQSIDNLYCSSEFARLNYQLSDYTDASGRKVRSVDMNKDGFVFLVMGFTGKDAARFKEVYIARFNEMEEELRGREERRRFRPQKDSYDHHL